MKQHIYQARVLSNVLNKASYRSGQSAKAAIRSTGCKIHMLLDSDHSTHAWHINASQDTPTLKHTPPRLSLRAGKSQHDTGRRLSPLQTSSVLKEARVGGREVKDPTAVLSLVASRVEMERAQPV